MHASTDFSTPIDMTLSDGNIAVSDYLYEQGASLAAGFAKAKVAGLSIHNAFTAIFSGGIRNSDLDTQLWLDRTISEGMEPTIQSVIKLFSIVASDGEDANRPEGWAANYVKALMDRTDFNEEEVQEAYQEIQEDIDEALDSAPELAEEMIEAFEGYQ